ATRLDARLLRARRVRAGQHGRGARDPGVRAELNERVEAARRELERVRPGAWRAGEPMETTEGRGVGEFVSDGQRLIGKLFAKADPARVGARLSGKSDGDLTYERQRWLAAFDTPTLRVPRPVVWCAAPRVLVTEAAEGRACRALAPCEWPD